MRATGVITIQFVHPRYAHGPDVTKATTTTIADAPAASVMTRVVLLPHFAAVTTVDPARMS